MKKILATYFIVVFGMTSIIPGYDFFQWTRANAMYIHFTEHAAPEDQDYNLLEFLIQHIFDSNHLNQNHPSHQNLPISGQNHIDKNLTFYNINRFVIHNELNQNYTYLPVFIYYSYDFTRGLFRPPR